jgi:Raf kinase inhibitor-like YbhB/YbcL family protein
MKIFSTAFENGGSIPAKYTCKGEDINPPLNWSGVPQGTQSLALIVDDPDAPVGLWTHWLVWNIDPAITEIKEGSVLGVFEGTTSAGTVGFHGPCPPSGEHRYYFKLFALDAKLDLPAKADRKMLEQTMQNHILDQASIMGLFKK